MHSQVEDEARRTIVGGRGGWRGSGLRGVAMVLALVGLSGRASADPPWPYDWDCPQGDLCIYSDAQGASHAAVWGHTGHMHTIEKCGWVDLGKLHFPGGGFWNDKVSAIYNHRAAGGEAHFYDYSGSGGRYIYLKTVGAGDYLLDLSKDTAHDGGPMNDRIDAIDVCGDAASPLSPDQLR